MGFHLFNIGLGGSASGFIPPSPYMKSHLMQKLISNKTKKLWKNTQMRNYWMYWIQV